MAQYIKSEFSTELALSVLNEIHYQRYNYYSFLGKCDPWNNSDSVLGTTQTQSVLDYKKIRNSIVYMKRVTSNDVSMVVRKIDWTPTNFRVYDQYDDGVDLRNKDFYCVNDEWDVFKCLSNNHGAVSVIKPVKPSTNFTDVIEHDPINQDGYVWKYMYSIPSFKLTKFVAKSRGTGANATPGYMPVQKALSDSFYNKGSVENIVITNPGSNYSGTPLTSIIVDAPVNQGGAVLIPSIRTTELLDGDGNVIEEIGEIVGVTIISGGLEESADVGYYNNTTNIPTLTLSTHIGVTGKYNGNTAAILTPIIENGFIVRVTIEDPGKNYPVGIDTYITVSGDGKDAKFTPVVYENKIIDVVTENVGIGYNVMILQVNDPTNAGTGAQLSAILGVSDYNSLQADVEQDAELQAGSIYAVAVEDGGSGFTSTVNTIIDATDGDGTGFLAEPIIASVPLLDVNGNEIFIMGVKQTKNAVVRVNVINFGVGYTYLNLKVVDLNNISNTTAKIRPIFPPTGGHGFNAIDELNSHIVVINSFIQKDVLLNKFNQDYRQLGIIKNPKSRETQTTFRDSIVNLCFEVLFAEVTDLIGVNSEFNIGSGSEDIFIVESTKSRFRVVAINTKKVLLQQLNNKYEVPLGPLKLERTGEIYNSVQVISAPAVDKFSGKLIYVSDEEPFSFADNQGLNIKTFLEF